jgi:hypothetical protein
MPVLRRVGFIREFYPGHASLPSLGDRMSTRRIRSESKLVEYLRAGHMRPRKRTWATTGGPRRDAVAGFAW